MFSSSPEDRVFRPRCLKPHIMGAFPHKVKLSISAHLSDATVEGTLIILRRRGRNDAKSARRSVAWRLRESRIFPLRGDTASAWYPTVAPLGWARTAPHNLTHLTLHPHIESRKQRPITWPLPSCIELARCRCGPCPCCSRAGLWASVRRRLRSRRLVSFSDSPSPSSSSRKWSPTTPTCCRSAPPRRPANSLTPHPTFMHEPPRPNPFSKKPQRHVNGARSFVSSRAAPTR